MALVTGLVKGGEDTLHVAVVIRNTVDCRVPLPADYYWEKPLPEGQVRIINPSDWAALEQAIALKEQGMVSKITVLCLDPEEGEEALRWCLAAKADAALRLWDPDLADADQLGRGKTLAAALQRLKVELVFSGNSCLDQQNSLMPGIGAVIAGMAYVTEIEKAEQLINGQAIVIRRREKGKREKIGVRLPAFLAFTGTVGISTGRAELADTLSAFTREIVCWDLADLGLTPDTAGGRGAKIANLRIRPYKPPLTKPVTPDVHLPAEQRLRTIISGGAARKQGEIVTGQPEKLAEKISEFLDRESVVSL